MRHRRADTRLGRKSAHRKALLASLVCGLISRKRITTTLQKAKLARSAADKIVTLGRRGTLDARRQVTEALQQTLCVRELFDTIVPQLKDRQGGYTRIIKLGHRGGDGAEMALLEWVDVAAPVKVVEETPAKTSKKK